MQLWSHGEVRETSMCTLGSQTKVGSKACICSIGNGLNVVILEIPWGKLHIVHQLRQVVPRNRLEL